MNFSQLSALKVLSFVSLTLALVGCGERDGKAELESAKNAYELKDSLKADKLLDKSLGYNPENVEALIYKARLKLDQGEIAEAKNAIERAVVLDGEAVDVRMLNAQIAYHGRDYDTAIKEFTAIYENQLNTPSIRSQALTGLGIVEMSCNNYDQARIDFLLAIRTDRRNASAWYHLGMVYRDSFGYFEAALEQFEAYVRIDEIADARVQKVQRVVIPELKESIAAAATQIPGALKRDPAAASAALQKAEAAMKKGTPKTARLRYQDAVNADPLSYPATFGLARAWEKTDKTADGQKKALEYYRMACKLSPGKTSTFITAGELALRLGFHAQAVEIYSRAFAANPTNTTVIDGLIRSLKKVGNRTKIADAYQRYRDALPKPMKK